MRFTAAFVTSLVAIANIAAAVPIASADDALVVRNPHADIKERDAQPDAQGNYKRDPQRDGQCYNVNANTPGPAGCASVP
ncbi:hypothetical protein BDV38DRAFT_280556 [Aspergillus pseudotamarii]|uniref:Uncharacterized protein n=1 Tax=Aspergillus pseudotamarii TaxID=132259 RepID=A0A5N6T177_ASPPS|nr:uncharacterized protein BDV38DRAFT_280556 [Aspergillus pseudotamarii]KAE8140090.1 hypothetical protein BDV38DRAFT_280556 [Aspergillus pseudotamarii]